MTLFRPCIDLHAGQVKQIVGSSLRDEGESPTTHFVSEHGPEYFASRYREDGVEGGHVICLGPGNEEAARRALAAWPGGLQLGGGVRIDNAKKWLTLGASKLIVTSWLFEDGELSMPRVRELSERVGREHLVIDLSCRRVEDDWCVATDRWQTLTKTRIVRETFDSLEEHCSEFLIHAADVEGKCQGIDRDLVARLSEACSIPCTYAGGARHIDDLKDVSELSGGRVDLTFGSSLDLFGGALVKYADCVAWNRRLGG